MILTISIISMILVLFGFIESMTEGKSNIAIYSAILILSVWYQDVTLGIITLCICSILCIFAMIIDSH